MALTRAIWSVLIIKGLPRILWRKYFIARYIAVSSRLKVDRKAVVDGKVLEKKDKGLKDGASSDPKFCSKTAPAASVDASVERTRGRVGSSYVRQVVWARAEMALSKAASCCFSQDILEFFPFLGPCSRLFNGARISAIWGTYFL